MHVLVYVQVCMHGGQRSTLDILFFPLFLRQFLPLAHQFGWTGWLAVTQDSPVSTHTALGVQACATAADFLFEC